MIGLYRRRWPCSRATRVSGSGGTDMLFLISLGGTEVEAGAWPSKRYSQVVSVNTMTDLDWRLQGSQFPAHYFLTFGTVF